MTNILDTVEPDGWRVFFANGNFYTFMTSRRDVEHHINSGHGYTAKPVYYDTESLLEAHRKQVLLEVVDRLPLKTVGIYDGDYQTGTTDGWNDAVDELRAIVRAVIEKKGE